MTKEFESIREPSIKDVRSQGGGRFVQCGHFADMGGSLDADVRNFWRMSPPVRTFCGQEERVNSSRFCAYDFYGRPLTLTIK